MAVVGKGGLGKFFIYDHNRLKKEEDDLIDAIVYFYPLTVSADEQCSLCGQLMGMSEFLLATISQSVPTFFKLQNEKYCLKRIGDYTIGLEGSLNESDYHIKLQLNFLYNSFVMFCGSFQNIYQQFVHNPDGFAPELRKIWNILYPLGCFNNNYISQVFQVMPMIPLPKSGSDLFCQASDILQASQRRPGVHVGAILYKNKVLCTQMPADLTRKLALVKPELPCIQLKTDFDISRSIRLITVYLTREEMKSVDKSFKPSDRHNHASKFVWNDQSFYKPSLSMSRSSASPLLRYGKMMESIPEKHLLELGRSAEISGDEFKSVQNNLIWTTHDEIEPSSEIVESCKRTKEERYETISDFEESVNTIGKQSTLLTVERSEAMIDLHEDQVKFRSKVELSDSGEKNNGALNLTVEADVHKDYTESMDSMNFLVKSDSSKDEPCSGYGESKLQSDSVINKTGDSVIGTYSQGDQRHISSSMGMHSTKSAGTHSSSPAPHSTSVDETHLNSCMSQKQITKNGSPAYNCLKVDCLHECSCDCDKKHTFVPEVVQSSAPNQASQTSKEKSNKSESVESKSISSINTDTKKSDDLSAIDDDVFVRVPQFEVDSLTKNSITDSDQEKGLLSPLGIDYLSEDSGSVEGSVSDVASLSTSRRKERFDFQSSADESSSEYGSYMSKRVSVDSTSNRKMPKIFRSRDNDSFESSDYSLQGTLQSSGTVSLQSSINGHSLGNEEKYGDQFWVPEKDKLYEMTLYIQGQAANQSSDISLLLLIDNAVRGDKSVIHSLWKDALPQLADLDFYVRESVDQHVDEGFMETSSYLKYDDLFHRIEGNEMDVPVNEDFQKLAGEIHKDYQLNGDFTSVALTEKPFNNKRVGDGGSHLCSCNSSRDRTNELYYHVDGPNSNK